MLYCASDAEVAELADAQDLGSCGREAVGVQLPPSALQPTDNKLAFMARFASGLAIVACGRSAATTYKISAKYIINRIPRACGQM
jgi:hypothetical protein